jgi:glutamate N-acetyltransferase/amino-acid N-acetyltransferase
MKICDVKGFKASGVAAGIKTSGKKDVAFIVSDFPANAAGVFTSNKVRAASVILSQKHLQSDKIKAVLMTSGNANAATGKAGLKTVEAMCKEASANLRCKPEEILVAQTGLIGIPLDEEVAVKGVKKAFLELSVEGSDAAAEAIMTTDTKPKHAAQAIKVSGKDVLIAGIAKGAAMLSPSMATMLATVVTDLSIAKDVMDYALRAAMIDSFHSMVVDGCRSTNDTVFLLANGSAENSLIDSILHPDYKAFETALSNVCKSLAMQMAGDAEGSNKFLIMKVSGAANKFEARLAAKAVVSSTLVKCSLAGENAYWGRVISELGASGADLNPEEVEIHYGNILICKNGIAHPYDENAAKEYMSGRDIVISAKIGNGKGEAEAYGCDLTHAYVDENMGKS